MIFTAFIAQKSKESMYHVISKDQEIPQPDDSTHSIAANLSDSKEFLVSSSFGFTKQEKSKITFNSINRYFIKNLEINSCAKFQQITKLSALLWIIFYFHKSSIYTLELCRMINNEKTNIQHINKHPDEESKPAERTFVDKSMIKTAEN